MTSLQGSETALYEFKPHKRRVVPPEKRKQAISSCDRCKIRKVACKRTSFDSIEPCFTCQKLGVDCKISIKRKPKKHGPIENIGLHYKCLLIIMSGIYPEMDVNNIDSLIELGTKLNLEMPLRGGYINKEESEYLNNTALTSKFMNMNKDNHQDQNPDQSDDSGAKRKRLNSDVKESHSNGSSSKQAYPAFEQRDSIIIDQGGNFHYIGPSGAPGLLEATISIISTWNNENKDLWSNYQNLFKSEIIISSKQDTLEAIDYQDLNYSSFPLINLVSREEADYYVENFFKVVHPRYHCFDEASFKSSYEALWMFLSFDLSNNMMLAKPQICCFYMVWLLGRMYKPYPNTRGNTAQLTNKIAERYLNIIRLCLSDMLLTPSLDGIRCMMLLSIYMDSAKKRESGYILLELATRQAISMGLNRQSIMVCTNNDIKVEEMKRTWWTLFSLELNFSNQMGRSSCIQIEEINIEYPTFKYPTFVGSLNASYKEIYYNLTDLSKILYELLEYKKSLNRDKELLSMLNMTKASNVKDKCLQWFNGLDKNLKCLKNNITNCKINLLLKYHHTVLSLTLPFLLYVSKNRKTINSNQLLLEFVYLCLESSIAIARILDKGDENGFFNGSIFADLFIAYHAAMGLVIGHLILSTERESKTKNTFENTLIKLNDIDEAIYLIKKVNNKNSKYITGSLKKVSNFIDILFSGLNILKVIGCSPSSKINDFDILDSNINKHYFLLKEKAKGDEEFPIIHMADVPRLALLTKRKNTI